MKTLVELFDECQIKNVIASLHYTPEKLVFVGYKHIMTEGRKASIERFFKMRGINAKTEYVVVGRYDLDEIVSKLTEIAEQNEGCYFDLTGGKELILVGMGIVSQKLSVPLFQFDIKRGQAIYLKNCENLPKTKPPFISIRESVILNGGDIINSFEKQKWNITPEFRDDVLNLWDICKKDSTFWNKQTGKMAGLDKNTNEPENLFINFKVKPQQKERDVLPDKVFLQRLASKKFIVNFHYKNDEIEFCYKSLEIKKLLTRAGLILEIYTYITALEIKKEDEEYYDDIDVGVYADWDRAENKSDDFGTTNEIDVLLMRDVIPVFISCKNGEVKKEALYELDTMASHFGGEFTKKVLITTYIDKESKMGRHFMQRARDMNISVIEGLANYNHEQFKSKLKNIAK